MNKMKLRITSGGILAVVGSLMAGHTVLATTYGDDLNAVSPVTVFIEEGDNTTVPPIDPIDPPISPVDPPNPTPGTLAIRYISSLDFGEVTVDGTAQVVNALQDVQNNGEQFDNMVTIRDVRSSTDRDGWTLTVKQDNELLEGATITMNPYVPEEVAYDLDISVGGEFTLNGESKIFAQTNTNTNPSGALSIGMAQPGEAVQLSIPEAEYVPGEYTTSLTWELVSGPLGK